MDPNGKESRHTVPGLSTWWLDVKLGFRVLVRYPGLAVVGIFGIAVAVAIAAGGFGIVYDNFLAPTLPLEEGDRVVSLGIWDQAANEPEPRILYDFRTWRDELRSIEDIGAFRTITANLISPGAAPQSVPVAAMSASGFTLARVEPLMGRHLVEADEVESAPRVLVIGESVWRNLFGSDPAILGQTIQLGTTPFSIVGVMPEGFAFPFNHRFWVPLIPDPGLPEPRTGPGIEVFGRLAPGAALASARAELRVVMNGTALEFPELYAQLEPQVRPYAGPLDGSGGIDGMIALTEFALMNLPAAMILLLVCVNFAILVYTRTAMRQGEIAIRTALGAGRGRIVVQLFIEALVLSAAGTVAGLAIAAIAIGQVRAATIEIRSELPFWTSLRISPEAVLYAGLLAVIAAAIVGVVPALKATRGGVGTVRVTADGSGMRLGRTWTLLIIAQVCFTVTLLPAAVYNAWENVRAEFVDPGFPAEEFLTASLGLDDIQSGGGATPGTTQFTRRYAEGQTELMRRLESEAWLSNVTFSRVIPGSESTTLIDTEASNRPTGEGERTTGHVVRSNRVDVDFFSTFGVGILAGRDFTPADAALVDGGAVVVSESFAREIFGGDALGGRIRYTERTDEVWYEIVGIVPDIPAGVSTGMLDSRAKLYHPAAAGEVVPATLALHVRDGDPETFAQRLAQIATDVDPALHVGNAVRLTEALHREQWIRRLEAGMLGAVSLSVLLLSSAGIYALMSFTVSKRRREIGIRIALGADRTRVIASIFSRALAQLTVGVALGVVVAGTVETGAHFLKGNAVVVLSLMAFFMMGVGVIAALGPARRCLGIEPTEALREE